MGKDLSKPSHANRGLMYDVGACCAALRRQAQAKRLAVASPGRAGARPDAGERPEVSVYPVGDRRRSEPIGAGKRRLGRGDNLNDCTSEK